MFKVGDKVVCVKGSIHGVQTNEIYTINHIEKNYKGEKRMYCVEGIDYVWDENRFKLYEGEENMELKDIIKVGYLVETKGDGYYLALQNQEDIVLVNKKGYNFIKNEYFDDDYEISKIYGLPIYYDGGLLSTETRELIWERSEEVKMTISEIEDKLGIKGLKIVKE